MSPIDREANFWRQRASIARQYANEEMAHACELIIAYCSRTGAEQADAEFLQKAQRLRKMLEAAEQHRTMCVEHGLSDSAIDATYEIQELEKKFIGLVKAKLEPT